MTSVIIFIDLSDVGRDDLRVEPRVVDDLRSSLLPGSDGAGSRVSGTN